MFFSASSDGEMIMKSSHRLLGQGKGRTKKEDLIKFTVAATWKTKEMLTAKEMRKV
jgi:hypothetical protein